MHILLTSAIGRGFELSECPLLHRGVMKSVLTVLTVTYFAVFTRNSSLAVDCFRPIQHTFRRNVAYTPRCLAFYVCVSYAEARLSYRLDVRPSICLLHAGFVSKRLNILSCFLHYTIAHSFLCISRSSRNSDGDHPLRGR